MENFEQSLVAFNLSIAKLFQHTSLVVRSCYFFADASGVAVLTYNEQTVYC